jgi:hypothetical protein
MENIVIGLALMMTVPCHLDGSKYFECRLKEWGECVLIFMQTEKPGTCVIRALG